MKLRSAAPQQISTPTPLVQHRFHLLDALRGIAALVVIFVHAPTALRLQPLYGTLAVDFFFCLSGFVIAFSYQSRLEQGMSIGKFMLVRWIRLYPLYLLGTLLMLLRAPLQPERIFYLRHTPARFLGLLIMALFAVPNFWTKAPSFNEVYPFNSPAWSIFYEALANLTHAALVRARRLNLILPLVGAAALAYLVRRAGMHLSLNGGVTADGTVVACARIAFSYSAGIYLYQLFRVVSWRPSKVLAGIIGSALVVCLPVLLCFNPGRNGPIYQLIAITVFHPLVVLAGSLVQTGRKVTPLCVLLGAISYPVYMLHPFFGLGEHNSRLAALMLHSPPLARGLYLSSLVLLLLFSWAAVTYFDEPVRRKLSLLARRTSRAVAQPDAVRASP